MPDFNPLDHLICLQHPARLAPSTWIEHVPFAMYLIDILRPRVFVELGTFYGVSYCAFCQAVEELGAGTRCYAVDTWQGDPQAGFFADEVLNHLREHHDPLYGGFSRLIQSDFDEAAGQFPEGSVDLLHIDGFHTYEAVRHDFETWLPKMSERGVVLFHDISVRNEGFGVWKFWDEVKAGRPHYEVDFGWGLGLIATGRERPAALSVLFDSPDDELRRIREYFHRLGLGLEAAQELHSLKKATRARDEASRAREERMRRNHPLLTRASNLLQVCAEHGLGAALRAGQEKIRRKGEASGRSAGEDAATAANS
ncbi:MAG TPA: class I SAM-dependent methyltransferase [Pyrinomonadaceae bacterium]